MPLINNGKIHIIDIRIKMISPFKSLKSQNLQSKKKKTKKEKINELYNIVIKQNKEIKDLKKDINDLKSFKEEFSKTIENIVNYNKKILEKKKFDEAVIIDNQSDIFNSLEEIDFLINRIKEEQKKKNSFQVII